MLLEIDTANKNVLVIGGCDLAANITHSLATNSIVTVVAQKSDLSKQLAVLAGDGLFAWFNRSFTKKDLLGKQYVFDFSSNPVIHKECEKKGIYYFNPENAERVRLPATSSIGNVNVTVSTNGAARLLEKSLTTYLGSLVPSFFHQAVENIQRLSEALHDAEDELTEKVDTFLRHISETWYLNAIAKLTDDQIDHLVELFHKLRDEDLDSIYEISSSILNVDAKKPLVRKPSESGSLLTANDSDSDNGLTLAGSPKKSSSDGKKNLLTIKKSDSSSTLLSKANEVVPEPKIVGVTKTLNGSEAVSNILYQLSDIAFIYPVFSEGYAGKELADWSASKEKNVYGFTPKVVNMTTRKGAGQTVQGALQAGSNANAIVSSAAIDHLLPALYGIIRDQSSAVFHVSTYSISKSLELYQSNKDIYKTLHTGFSLISSSTIQEAQDMALVSHIASESGKLPILHFFDGVKLASQADTLSVLTRDDIKQLLPLIQATDKSPFDTIEHVMTVVSQKLNRTYKPLEYYGSTSAELVLVALGNVKAVLEEAVVLLTKSGLKVGFLNIRVFRPWSPKQFQAALPKTVKTILVIDQLEDGKPSPVSFDVESSFYGQSWGGQVPSIVTKQFKRGIENIHSSSVHDFISNYFKHQSFDQEIEFKPSTIVSTHRSNIEAILWDRKLDGTIKSSQKIFEHLKNVPRTFIQSYVQHASTAIEAFDVTHIKFNQKEIKETQIITSADLVFVNELSIIQPYNFVGAVRQNGAVFVNTSLTQQEFIDSLSADVKHELIKRQVHIYLLDATLVSKNYTIFYGSSDDYLNEILTALFYKLSFNDTASVHLQAQISLIEATEQSRNVIESKREAILYALTHLEHVKPLQHISTFGDDSLDAKLPIFVRGTVPSKSNFSPAQLEHATDVSSRLVGKHLALLPVIFPSAYKLQQKLRPDVDNAYTVTVTENVRLTPDSYDRNVFHMELDITGTGLKYEIGDALGVYPQNNSKAVADFLDWYSVDPSQIVYIDRPDGEGNSQSEVRTVEQLFIQQLDAFGKPGKKFYQFLAVKATADEDKESIAQILKTNEVFDKFVEDYTPTFVDLLKKFPSARPTVDELIKVIPSMKPRHYSIASSQRVHENSVHLLVVLVGWKSVDGVERFGQATQFLVDRKVGDTFTVSIKPSVMKLPESLTAPVVMSGLGTGMAPFRAFIQERWYWKTQGHEVGPMVLYFGSRNRANEYLYGEELEAYNLEGTLPYLRLAFSRDQKQKIYIQHKIQEDAELLHKLLVEEGGSFYLCGPTWPVPDVTDALLESFNASMTGDESKEYLEKLKNHERFVLEVY